MILSADTWQLVFVDALFLCVAGGLGLWFRSWLRREKEDLDRRLDALEAQQARLERISGRLQSVCRVLEMQCRQEEAEPTGGAPRRYQSKDAVSTRASREQGRKNAGEKDRYEQAWELLTRGMSPGEIARRLDLGIAEVELMGHMLRRRQRP